MLYNEMKEICNITDQDVRSYITLKIKIHLRIENSQIKTSKCLALLILQF